MIIFIPFTQNPRFVIFGRGDYRGPAPNVTKRGLLGHCAANLILFLPLWFLRLS